MTCQDCGQPATVHALDVVDGNKCEVHLCRKCAAKRQLLPVNAKLNLPTVVKNMVTSVSVLPSDLAKLECPHCGTTYMEFRKRGRLGCFHDYVVFHDGLLPLLDRVHRRRRHTGKRPKQQLVTAESPDDIILLRRQLRRAIEAEDFEEAMRVRDILRTKGLGNGS